MKRLLAILLMLSFVVSLVACAGDTKPANSVPEKAETEQSDSPRDENPESFELGDIFTLGDWDIALFVEFYESIQYDGFFEFTPEDGSQYCLLEVFVKNNGTTAATFFPSLRVGDENVSITLIYKDTYEYTPSVLMGHSGDIHDKMLNPLTELSGVLAFQVPQEVADNQDEVAIRVSLGDESAVIPDITFFQP